MTNNIIRCWINSEKNCAMEWQQYKWNNNDIEKKQRMFFYSLSWELDCIKEQAFAFSKRRAKYCTASI